MRIKISEAFVILLFTLIATEAAILVPGLKEGWPDLIIYNIRGTILGLSLVCLFKNFVEKSAKITPVHTSILFFILMFAAYGFFSPYWMQLRTVLFVLAGFYLFYYLSFKGYLLLKHIQILAIFLLIIFAVETYLGIFERADMLYLFFARADNVGYKSMYLMLFFALDIRKMRNIILLSLTYALVLISFKRGAMMIATICYLLAMWPIVFGQQKFRVAAKTRENLLILSVVLFIIISILIVIYWDVLIFRFIEDKTGGSGREKLYNRIYEGWRESPHLNQIFGHGFSQVPYYLERTYGKLSYSHSDWAQLLFEHGIFGITVYISVIMSYVSQSKMIMHFTPDCFHVYLMTIVMWLLKSVYSGVYVYKDSLLFFLVVGWLLGNTYRKALAQREKEKREAVVMKRLKSETIHEYC